VKYSDVLDQLPIDRGVRRVYGEPYETTDGATVIPVARIRAGRPRFDRGSDQGSGQDAQEDAGAPFGINAVPLGVFVIRGGEASWVPAIDANRVALIGVFTGVLAAVIASLAVLRQPPWPRITITDYR
jgi:uncharacterized spore protein YtfJ